MKIISLIFALSIFSFLATNLAWASESSQNILPTQVITATVNQVTNVLTETYVYPEVAKEIETFLKTQLSAGRYNSHSQRELIAKLQTDLRSTSKDGHLELLLAEDSVDRTSVVVRRTKSQNKIHTEVISGARNGEKIGYLQINTFSGDPETEGHLINAMESVSSTDSLIIDLRENGGGSPNFVALLSSYFVENDTQLWSVIDRNGNQALEVRSQDNQNKFDGDLCILTSKKTYSAAEAFAYTLKHLSRASIVGEETGGGAHLVDMIRVNDEIDMRVPVLRAYNHITESNWEGVGVIPTLKVKASDAKIAAVNLLNGNTE